MPSPMATSTSQTITTVVFGITATVISIVTVWYSYRAFKIWHDRREVENTDSDIELGMRSNHQPSPTERFELPPNPSFPNVEVGSAPHPSHEATAEPSIVGNHETSTTPRDLD